MHEAKGAAAFTLIDLLAVIAVMTVLISLLMPALARVQTSARDLKSLANIRSHAQVFAMYHADWDGWFPQFADPRADYSVVRDDHVAVTFQYFVGVVYWPIALSRKYYDGRVVGNDIFLHPRDRPGAFNSYILSSALMAEPAYWRPETREEGTHQWRGCRIDMLAFPSAKAQLMEWHPVNPLPIATPAHVSDLPGVALALADGAAARFHTRELVPPYPFGDGQYQEIGIFGMHTIDGWLGRDVR